MAPKARNSVELRPELGTEGLRRPKLDLTTAPRRTLDQATNTQPMQFRIPMSLRSKLIVLTLPALLALQPVLAPAQDGGDSRVDPTEVIGEMTWLAGNWAGDMWGGRFSAYYTTPEGGKIISHSRLTHGEDESFYEFEVFEAHEDVVRLQPFPGGKKASSFVMKSHDPKAKKAVFENPENDYPTRIVYHRAADDSLVVTLSDPFGESDKVEKFDLKRESK